MQVGPSPDPPISMPPMLPWPPEADVAAAAAEPVVDDAISIAIDVVMEELMVRGKSDKGLTANSMAAETVY